MAPTQMKKDKMMQFTPGGTQNHNPQLRRLMPYPLGQGGLHIFLHSYEKISIETLWLLCK